MALTKVKPGGIHADLSSAISGSHTSGFEYSGTISGSSISTGSFGVMRADGIMLRPVSTASVAQETGSVAFDSNDNTLKVFTGVEAAVSASYVNVPTNGWRPVTGWVKLMEFEPRGSAILVDGLHLPPFGSTYHTYRIYYTNLQTDGDCGCRLRFHIDGIRMGADIHWSSDRSMNNSANYVGDGGNDVIEANFTDSFGGAANENGNFCLEFYDPEATNSFKLVNWWGSNFTSDGLLMRAVGYAAHIGDGDALTGLELNTNNTQVYDHGDVVVYGFSK